MPRFAAFVSPGRSASRAPERAAEAERLGYELVMDNHIANRDALVSLVAYGQATSTVQLGTGVYPAFLMSPLALAQAAATVDELIGGRLVLGIGTSHRALIEGWHGLAFPDRPVQAMREIVGALRSLLGTGELGATDGRYVRSGGFRFQGFTPRPDIPIYLSALSPKMLQLAGEVADGVVLWLCGPTYIAEVVTPAIAEGAARAGRDPAEVEVVAAVSCAVTENVGAAADAFRTSALPYFSLPFYRAMLERAGFGDDIAAFDAGLAARDVPRALAGIGDDAVHHLAAIGDGDRVRAKLEEYRAAGASLPAVGPLLAEGSASFEEVLAAAIGSR